MSARWPQHVIDAMWQEAQAETRKETRESSTVYAPEWTIAEWEREAKRLDRSMSWVVQQAVRIALPKLKLLRTN